MYFEANGGNRVEPLEVISKFYSIWISHGELRGQELSCEKCTISVFSAMKLSQKRRKRRRNSSAHTVPKCTYIKKHSISTFLPINKFLLTTVINSLYL